MGREKSPIDVGQAPPPPPRRQNGAPFYVWVEGLPAHDGMSWQREFVLPCQQSFGAAFQEDRCAGEVLAAPICVVLRSLSGKALLAASHHPAAVQTAAILVALTHTHPGAIPTGIQELHGRSTRPSQGAARCPAAAHLGRAGVWRSGLRWVLAQPACWTAPC